MLSVVLAFGGQSKPTIGLDKTLYDSSPRLRAYLDECNGILQDLGYPGILPGVFSQEAGDYWRRFGFVPVGVDEIAAALPDTPQVQSGLLKGWIEREQAWKRVLGGGGGA